MNIVQSPSQNFDERSEKPSVIVIHCTDSPFPQDLNWLRDPVSNVSSHFLIAPDGTVHRLVDMAKRAWHAGRIDTPTAPLRRGTLGVGYINPNEYSIGIEVSLKPPALPSSAQLDALRALIRDKIAPVYGIPIDRKHIWGHREIYAKKTCPATINVDELVRSLQNVVTPAKVESREEIKSQIINLLAKL